jgi:hypothetical protein
MVRRVIGVIVGSVALATSLSGCLFPIDAAKPVMHVVNDSSQEVVVTIEGTNVRFPKHLASQDYYTEVLDECQGTGIRVETKSGELIGRVDAQACPNWTLTINKDDSLNYVEDK